MCSCAMSPCPLPHTVHSHPRTENLAQLEAGITVDSLAEDVTAKRSTARLFVVDFWFFNTLWKDSARPRQIAFVPGVTPLNAREEHAGRAIFFHVK